MSAQNAALEALLKRRQMLADLQAVVAECCCLWPTTKYRNGDGHHDDCPAHRPLGARSERTFREDVACLSCGRAGVFTENGRCSACVRGEGEGQPRGGSRNQGPSLPSPPLPGRSTSDG